MDNLLVDRSFKFNNNKNEIILTKEDVVSIYGCITTNLMNAFIIVYNNSFPDKQMDFCDLSMYPGWKSNNKNGIQIIYNHDRKHYILTNSINNKKIDVYDSLAPVNVLHVSRIFSASNVSWLKEMYGDDSTLFMVKLTFQQQDSDSCGIHVIFYLLGLIFQRNFIHCECNISKMRISLFNMLVNELITIQNYEVGRCIVDSTVVKNRILGFNDGKLSEKLNISQIQEIDEYRSTIESFNLVTNVNVNYYKDTSNDNVSCIKPTYVSMYYRLYGFFQENGLYFANFDNDTVDITGAMLKDQFKDVTDKSIVVKSYIKLPSGYPLSQYELMTKYYSFIVMAHVLDNEVFTTKNLDGAFDDLMNTSRVTMSKIVRLYDTLSKYYSLKSTTKLNEITSNAYTKKRKN